MRVAVLLFVLSVCGARGDDWTPMEDPGVGLRPWYREPRSESIHTTTAQLTTVTNKPYSTTFEATTNAPTTRLRETQSTIVSGKSSKLQTTPVMSTEILTTLKRLTTPPTMTTTDFYTQETTTEEDEEETTGESRDNGRVNEYFANKEKASLKTTANISQNLLPLPAGAGAALVKPTKYHYYPHNQHIYLLPECAIQQVCNAVYVRLNWTQPLCACPSRYRDPCSASLNSDDLHTTELIVNPNAQRALTLVKTCEPTADMRICRTPRDWSLLALQNIRTGKSHYLVICRCPDTSILEGPMSHDQPTYASVPGIRVYGMMCVPGGWDQRRGRPLRLARSAAAHNHTRPAFPWDKVAELVKTAQWD